MINAEVGTLLPHTGGQYVFLHKMYGDFFAFLYGWAAFIVINTAAIAAIAFVFAEYAETFVSLPRFSPEIEKGFYFSIPGIGKLYPLEKIGVKALAVFVLGLLTAINYISVKAGNALQVLFTGLKVLALLILVGMIFFSGKGSLAHFSGGSSKEGWELVLGLVAALSGALASYDGWNNLGFVAGEIRNPQKNIPRGLFLGITICLLLYVLTNLAYIYAIPVHEMSASDLVDADAILQTVGLTGAGFIAILVMLSTFGAVNGNLFPCARIQFAMAQEGVFFKTIGLVHPRFQTPGNALILQGIWAVFFILTGSFDMLTDLFVFVTWLFYGFGAYGLFILRRKLKDAERPYKTWGYPVVPIIFLLFAGFYFFLTLYNDYRNFSLGKTAFINSAYGLLLTAMGIPLYFFFKRRGQLKS